MLGFCFVYLIQCAETAYYKVGIADEPEKRLDILQIGCPYPLSIVLTCRMLRRVGATTAEAQIHRSLNKYNVHGEWFELPDDVLSQLKIDMISCSEMDSQRENTLTKEI